MKSKIPALLLAVCAACTGSSCNKDRLPRVTHDGKNIFGCKVNGEYWVPHGGGGFSGIESVNGGYQHTYRFNTTSNNVFILANDGNSSVNIYLRSVEKTGVYLLEYNTFDITNQQDPYNYGYFYSDDGKEYITSSKFKGKVDIIRADTIHKIISGTFEFLAVDGNTGKIVRVTDGRFDVKTH